MARRVPTGHCLCREEVLPDWRKLCRMVEGTVAREQVQQSLIEEMSEMDIIDTHEHLPNESERLQQPV
ncbi:MAG: hypothetical protein MUQ26_06535, partial [Armatimonadetes bacterium]|nr:hypothetical protein [Armatimonadota bacterium]